MKEPSIEDIRTEENLYKEHLNDGGRPVQVIAELHPWEHGLEWQVRIVMPENLISSTKWITEFTCYARDRIVESIQPPKDII